jgi:hypothetical protein
MEKNVGEEQHESGGIELVVHTAALAWSQRPPGIIHAGDICLHHLIWLLCFLPSTPISLGQVSSFSRTCPDYINYKWFFVAKSLYQLFDCLKWCCTDLADRENT